MAGSLQAEGRRVASSNAVVEEAQPQGRIYSITFQPGQMPDLLTADGSLLAPRDAVQQVDVVNASGGTFKLSFKGSTTGALDAHISASALEQALVGLGTIGKDSLTEDNVHVDSSTLPSTTRFTIEFQHHLGTRDSPSRTPDAT